MENKYYVFDKYYYHAEFDTYDELLGFLNSISGYNPWYYWLDSDLYVDSAKDYFLYIRKQCWYDVYDGDLNLIDNDKLINAVRYYTRKENKLLYRGGYIRSCYENNYLGFRNGPVPGVHKGGRYGNSLRHPKTRQEIAANSYDKEYSRAKRRGFNLPTYYDDIGRSNWNAKSWKNQKIRKQWQKKL